MIHNISDNYIQVLFKAWTNQHLGICMYKTAIHSTPLKETQV